MPEQWTPRWEMEKYWDFVMSRESEINNYELAFRADLEVFGNIALGGVVVDVGAGGLGGVFRFLDGGDRRIIVDPLASEFDEKFGQMQGAELVDASCQDIPLESGCADIVFCIEALDHCSCVDEYRRSAGELIRIIKPGGRLYFMIPFRKENRDGHFITAETITAEEILAAFDGIRQDMVILTMGNIYMSGTKQ